MLAPFHTPSSVKAETPLQTTAAKNKGPLPLSSQSEGFIPRRARQQHLSSYFQPPVAKAKPQNSVVKSLGAPFFLLSPHP